MSGIVEFLEARIAEDETVAQAAIGMAAFSRQTGRWTAADVTDEYGKIPLVFAVAESGARTQVGNFSAAWEADERRTHIARHDPARVLAECASKRNIVSVYRSLSMRQHANDAGSIQWHEADSYYVVLRTLARIYKDHPDYRQEWAT